jgi:radical SAM superfamily enzyme YgiQ (UPF0313 family)
MARKVDLLLVNPGNRLEQFASLSDLATVGPPLGIGMTAAYARQHGISVDIIDAEAEFWLPEDTIAAIEDYDPLVVGLTAFTTKMTAAGRILGLVKERMPQVKTLLGGHHASAVPERTLREEAADFVLKGEGYDSVVSLVQHLKERRSDFMIPGIWYLAGDKVIGNGTAAGTNNLDELPYAAWDLLPMEKYRAHHWQAWDYELDQSRFAMIYTSLGCPFSCEYCSVNVVYGKNRVRYRSAEHVVGEMKMLVDDYGVQHIEIVDDTFTVNKKRVNALCDEIIAAGLGERVNMWCFGRTDTVSPEIMRKMKQAGINWLFMGFESGNDFVLQGVNKKQNVEQIKRANEIVHEAGLHVGGNYIFGLPTDTVETMQETLDLAKSLNTEYANFFLTMAYPGTDLHDTAHDRNYPLPEKWGQYGFFAPDAVPMRNEQLGPEDIIEFRDNAFKEYFGSTRYQDMVRDTFGDTALTFLRDKVLSKDITRVRRTL